MINNFDALSRTLDLKSPATDSDLNKLIDWCETTVSTDLHIDGDLKDRFDFYRKVSEDKTQHKP
ncbi:MAG: hypothetical protein PSV35_01615 [bacterium]|nr:hypothetical protein [bacterium]